MATKGYNVLICLLVLVISLNSSTRAVAQYCDIGTTVINRHSFPPNFTFGGATSAYQIEGAAFVDGRRASIWDTFAQKHPEKIKDGSNGDVAVKSYNLYEEDVKIMKEMNLDAYRFSISWPRLLPNGKLQRGGVNKKGIEYYDNLINNLISNGIEPFATLFHWDTPEDLEVEYGGFLSDKIVDDFRDFADLCFKKFGDRVKQWITFNEPWSYSFGGYAIGSNAPGRCSFWQSYNCTGGDSSTEPYIATHNQLLAHAATVKLYREKYQESQKGSIGITLVSSWFEPYSSSRDDEAAAERAMDQMLGWYMDPITNGDYPCSMRTLVGGRLPKFTEEQSEMLVGSYDFIGLNYYTSRYAYDLPSRGGQNASYLTDDNANLTTERNGAPIGPQAGSSWLYVFPQGIYNLTLYVKEKYGDPVIYITENGVDEVNNPTDSIIDILEDDNRVQYHCDHLLFLQQAIEDGVNIKGYFAWSLLDNWEWSEGWTVRFGMNYVERQNNFTRYPKMSALWFKSILQEEDADDNKSKPRPIKSIALEYEDHDNKFKPRISY